MFIGNRLKEARNSKNMTQSELGKLINVTKVSICCYEKGTRTPSLDTLDDLSSVFGVDANYFLGKDISVVNEDTSSYSHYVSKEELRFLSEVKLNRDLYKLIIEDPKRAVELISKKLK